MRKTFTALRMLLIVASIGFVGLCSATAFTFFDSWTSKSMNSTSYLGGNHNGINENTQNGHKGMTPMLSKCSSASKLAILKMSPPTTPDTFYIGLPGGGGVQTCLDLGGAGRSIQNIRHCGGGTAQLKVSSLNDVCINVTALSQIVTDTFCAQNCSRISGNCRDMVLIFNSVSRFPRCGAISSRSLITINTPTCGALGCYCLADSIDINDLKNNYTIRDNNINYVGGYKGCNFDTIYSYTYFTVPNMGRRGPYRLDSWHVNSTDYKITSFNTMQQLVDSMNVWDPVGNWQLDTTVFAISGGSTRNSYGQMKITRIANRAIGFLELNLGIISNGIQMCFSTGGHQVVFKNNTTGCSDTITVRVVCADTMTNLKPHAVDDIATTTKNAPVTVKVLTNDVYNGILTGPVSIVGSPRRGRATVLNNEIVYTPPTDFCGGQDTVSYQICNANGCDTADIVITVNCPVTPHIAAVDDRITTPKNTKIRFAPLSNDTIIGSLLALGLVTSPRHGSIGFVGTDSLDYIPNIGYCGFDTLEYRVCNTSFICDTATIFITVMCDTTQSPKPNAIDDVATTKKKNSVTIDVLANDQLNGNLVGLVKVVNLPTHGSTTYLSNQIVYTPDTAYCGIDGFTYQICNANGCDTARVVVSITCDSITPTHLVAVDDHISTPKNVAIRFTPIDNDTLVGSLLGLGAVSPPRHGSINFIGIDSLVYIPKLNYCGLDTMEYRLCNTNFICDTATIFIRVTCDTPTLLKPDAVTDIATTKKNQTVTVTVLTNDILNGTLTAPVSITTNPKRGTATVVANQIVYTPNADVCGFKDTLSYTICNVNGCDIAQVIVDVTCDTPTLLKPDAVTDIATTKKNQTVTVTVLTNDILNGTLTGPVSITTNPKRGTATVVTNKIVYTPNADVCGFKDTLSYTICNVNGCDIAQVIVDVTCDTPTLLKPDAVTDIATTKKNQTVTVTVLTNDILNGTLTGPVSITTNPKRGTATVVTNQVVYTPNADVCGFKDTLSYTICNVNGCDIAQVIVDVTCDTPTLLKPDAVTDIATTKKNQTVTVTVLANDILNGTLTGPVSITTNPKRGTATVVANQIVYTPNADVCGFKDTLSYTICNVNGCDIAQVIVDVTCDTPILLKPDAVTDIATTKKNQTVTVTVLTNDILNGTLTGPVSITTNPKRGTATVVTNQIVYTPNADICGFKDTLSYTICNVNGCDIAQVIIDVTCDTPTLLKPDAVTDIATTKKNQTVTVTVLTNDILNGTLTGPVSITTNPKRGTATVVANQIVYTPNADVCGFKDTLSYTICNVNGCDIAQVIVDVTCDTPTLLKPDAVTDIATTKKNQTVTVTVLTNDILNGTLTGPVSITTNPKRGTATVVTNQVVYTPNADICGFKDTLSYTICNVNGCDIAQVIVDVTCDTPTLLKPDAVTDIATTKKNQAVTVTVLTNDILNGTLTAPVSITTNPKRGTATVVANQIVYTPNTDVCGFKDTLSYTICNVNGCDIAQVIVDVTCDTPTLLKPDAVTDIATTKKNQTVTVTVLTNDILNGTLTGPVSITTNPKRGTATVVANQIVYTPNADICGFKDTLSYTICNVNGCDIAQVIIDVTCDTPILLKPDAVTDIATTKKNQTVTVTVLTNDILNGTLTGPVSITTNPKRGTATVESNKIVYTPNRDICGFKDTLSYTICNVNGCDIAQVIVDVTCDTIRPKERPIVAVDDNVTTPKNVSLSFRPTRNDTIRTSLLTLEVVTMPRHGSASFRGLDTLMYVPNLDYCGLDTMEYRICDTAIICDTATIFITVKCDAAAKILPIAVNDFDSTKVNTSVLISVLKNDTINGLLVGPLSIVNKPTLGTATVNSDGKIEYKPFNNFCGNNDVFTYQICNSNGCDTAEVTVKVICDTTITRPPVAVPDVVTTPKNTPISITILANDTINGTLDSIKIIRSPLFGTAILGRNNVVTYTPDSCGFTDSLIYRICNRNGCDTALVTIKVTCDVKPIAIDDSVRTSKNRSVLINVVGNDSLFSSSLGTLTVLKRPTRGSVLVENGKIRYLPQTDSCGYRDTFSYVICTAGGCDTANVVVTVSCNETLLPTAEPDTARTKSGQGITINVIRNDSLRGADTFRITRAPLNGTAVVIDTIYGLRYTPNASFCGKDTLIYEICNRNGCDTALVTITVVCVPPVAIDDSAKTRYNQVAVIPIVLNDTLNGADSISVITHPTHGLVTILVDKTATYTPSRDFCGKDSFRYVICNRIGCDTAVVRINISCGDTLIIFNGISPNQDGKNDGFYIRGIENYPENEVVIFNRWGNEVYRKKGYRNDTAWQGTWNNFSVPDGTYFYCINLNDGKTPPKVGYLMIMK